MSKITKRPTNVQELMEAIRTITDGKKGTFEDARWYCAMDQAKIISESYSWKDLAYSIIGGIKMTTEEDVNEFLASFDYEEEDEEIQREEDERFIENLIEFYS